MTTYVGESGMAEEGDGIGSREMSTVALAAASVWTNYPSTPNWFYPGWAVSVGAVGVGVAGADDSPAYLGLVPVAAALFLSLLLWYVHVWGNWPGSAWPTAEEFRPAIYAYCTGCALLLAGGVTAYTFLGLVPATLLVVVATWLGLTVYERRYEVDAQAARARLTADVAATEVSLDQLDRAFPTPERMAVVAILANSQGCDATFLRKQLGMDDDELFDVLSALLAAEYLKVTEWWGRSWYSLTKAGKQAAKQPMTVVNGIVRGRVIPA